VGQNPLDMPSALHHATIISRDSRNIIRLLHDVLGLPITAELVIDATEMGTLLDWYHDSRDIRSVLLGGGTAGLVEVIDLADSREEDDPGQEWPLRTGVNQLCFAVRDLDTVLDACRQLGLPHQVRGRQDIQLQGQRFSVAALVVDGLRIQLSQLCPGDS
jgi:catechol 2,3-dioxygenase-like lactoylglutathione lyase family enzyme